ncbi:MAG TPA: hypothetical protein VLC08_12285 [Chitinolyticbacter sp.]|nr:hypothetical protein [Chitinolyticbacter sp.]
MDGSGHGNGPHGGQRPFVQNGVLGWAPAQDPRVGRAFVPFSGTGHRIDATHGDAQGPLSPQNIAFLRAQADLPQPVFMGMRHTSNEADRNHSASSGGHQRPGFYGDAYSLVPRTTAQNRYQQMAQSRPDLFQGLRASALTSPGFAGTDQEFNRAVEHGIRNSVNWDLARSPGRTVEQRVGHLGDNTQFALVNMGHQPGTRTDATYGASTPSFGKKHVPAASVFREIQPTGQQLVSELPRGLRTQVHNPSNDFEVTESLVGAFGRRINSALDTMRPLAPSNDSAAQRRERMAAAAELRALQGQARGRPAERERLHDQMHDLQSTVRAPTR